jgi:hypothetical protein
MPVSPADLPPPAPIAAVRADPHVVQATNPPAPVIMPPVQFGPPGDPQGLGPVLGNGPPPGPMYPNPGPYAAPTWQPAGPGLGGAIAANLPAGTPGAAPHTWTSLDYLLYFAKAQSVPFPLLTTSAPSDQGLLGRASTLVLAGQSDLGYNSINGGRITTGFFGDCNRRFGFEASGFLLEQKSNITDITSSPSSIPTLARPFIDSTNVRAGTSLVLANPGLGNGRVVVDTSTQSWGVEANGIWNLFRSAPDCKWGGCSFDFIAGYRFFSLKESLDIDSATNLALPPTIVPIFVTGPGGVVTQVGTVVIPGTIPFGGLAVASPASILVQDNFLIYNRFNGGQVGFRAEAHKGMFVVSVTGKFAIGDMHERIEVTGQSGFNNPTTGRVGTAFGGLFANASNIGTFNHDEFAVMPEFNGNLGIYITRGLTAFIGYNFLYVNKVARPGSQINPIVNTATVPFSPNYGATNRPLTLSNLFVQDDFWLMGINFGLRLQY